MILIFVFQKFFRRGLRDSTQYTCKNDGGCIISPQSRNSCRSCRFERCLKAGMSREGEINYFVPLT